MIINDIFDVKDKVIIITGAAGNLGSKYAKVLGQAGANVVLCDLDYETCKKLSTKINDDYGVKSIPVKLDLRKNSSVENLVKKLLKHILRLMF